MENENKRNLIFTAVLLLTAAVIYFFIAGRNASSGQPKAQIYYDSKLVKTIILEEGAEQTFSVSQKEAVLFHQYPDGTICFEESDCPDQVCVRSGRLGAVGQSAACLPNHLVLKIVSGPGDGVDAETGP